MKGKFSKYLVILSTALLTSCGCLHHLPPAENNVTVKDSVRIEIKDSTVLHYKTVNRDYTGLLDTLKISGEHSHMTAFADTTNFTIKGELQEDPFEEKIKYVDRIQFRDSIKVEKIPYPVEVVKEKKYIPKFFWGTLVFSVLVLLLFGVKIYLKIKTGGIQLPKFN